MIARAPSFTCNPNSRESNPSRAPLGSVSSGREVRSFARRRNPPFWKASKASARAVMRATSGDARRFDALQQRAYAWNREMLGVEPMPLQVAPADVLARYETWLLEDGEALLGALALEPRPDHLLIWSVSIDPDRQNGGLGRTLLGAAEARARALGLSTLRLYTGAPLTKNIDWYGRRGYAVERIEEMADRRAVHMVKTIET